MIEDIFGWLFQDKCITLPLGLWILIALVLLAL